MGILYVVECSKKRVFDFVKDKVWKKIQGWSAKPITRAGEEILIKMLHSRSHPIVCHVFNFPNPFVGI